jgi:hypothetical protein
MHQKVGFSLIELFVSLAMVAIVAAFVVHEWFDRSEVTLENAAVLMARDLRSAQDRGAYFGEPVRFSFLAEGDGYEALDETGRVIQHPRTGLPFERRYSESGVFRGVFVVEVRFGADRSVDFDQDGRALESGEVTLAFGSDRRTIRLEKLSGRLTIVGSTSDWYDAGY